MTPQSSTSFGPRWDFRLMGIHNRCRVENWDSYHADAVTDDAIRVAEAVCKSLDVSPTVNGGVQVSLASEGICIVIGPDGGYHSVVVDTEDLGDRIRFFQNSANPQGIRKRGGLMGLTIDPSIKVMTPVEQVEYWMDRCFAAEDEKAALINQLSAIQRTLNGDIERV